jgi:predicted esterase
VEAAHYRNAKGKRLAIAHGTADASVPYAEAQATRKLLERHGAWIEWRPIEGGGHTLPSSVYSDLVSWLAERISGDEPGASAPPSGRDAIEFV